MIAATVSACCCVYSLGCAALPLWELSLLEEAYGL